MAERPPALAAVMAAVMAAGGSRTREMGTMAMKARIVSTAYRLVSDMFSPTPAPIVFLAARRAPRERRG